MAIARKILLANYMCAYNSNLSSKIVKLCAHRKNYNEKVLNARRKLAFRVLSKCTQVDERVKTCPVRSVVNGIYGKDIA